MKAFKTVLVLTLLRGDLGTPPTPAKDLSAVYTTPMLAMKPNVLNWQQERLLPVHVYHRLLAAQWEFFSCCFCTTSHDVSGRSLCVELAVK